MVSAVEMSRIEAVQGQNERSISMAQKKALNKRYNTSFENKKNKKNTYLFKYSFELIIPDYLNTEDRF